GGAAEDLLLDTLLESFRARGYLRARGRQRTDATHVLAALRVLNRIEQVAETLRAALNAVATLAQEGLPALSPPESLGRYGRRIEDDRLPKGREARDAYAEQVGADGMRLLTALFDAAAPPTLRDLPAVDMLRRIWIQQFVVVDDRVRLRDPQ